MSPDPENAWFTMIRRSLCRGFVSSPGNGVGVQHRCPRIGASVATPRRVLRIWQCQTGNSANALWILSEC